jgi:hypothetical protein
MNIEVNAACYALVGAWLHCRTDAAKHPGINALVAAWISECLQQHDRFLHEETFLEAILLDESGLLGVGASADHFQLQMQWRC